MHRSAAAPAEATFDFMVTFGIIRDENMINRFAHRTRYGEIADLQFLTPWRRMNAHVWRTFFGNVSLKLEPDLSLA